MAKLARVKGKVFAGSAQLSDIGQFGSALAGTPTNTQDVATIQALSAYDEGWNSAVITSRNYPPIEEVNGVLKTISYQTCYMLQEGIPEYDIGTEYSNTSIVKSVNGTRLDFYISLQNNNIGHALSDTDYWAKATLNAGKNIGEIVTSVIPLSDSGLHLLDGTVLSGNGVYADFVNYIASIYDASLSYFTTEADWQNSVSKYGSCGKFVYDSVNNTVRLPKIVGFIEGTSGVSALGNLTQAGLPNITGNIGSFRTWTPNPWSSGAFSWSNIGTIKAFDTGHVDKVIQANFNASNSNSIYGKSSTVQPQSIKVLYYIVLANDVKNTLQVDIDEILNDLAGKADTDFSNVNSVGSSLSAGWAMPSETHIDLTLGASGSQYTAPANGWLKLTLSLNAKGYIGIGNVFTQNGEADGAYNSVLFPLRKGQTVTIAYANRVSTIEFRFVYAQGSESEAS